MSPRNGRPPSNNPKGHRKSYRLSDEDMRKLKYCTEKTGMTETDIIRTGIDWVYQETLKKKK